MNHILRKIKHEQALIRLKQSLEEPSFLGLRIYSKTFTLFVHEGNNQALGNLMEEHGKNI